MPHYYIKSYDYIYKRNSYRNYFFSHVQLLILETSFVRVCQAINFICCF